MTHRHRPSASRIAVCRIELLVLAGAALLALAALGRATQQSASGSGRARCFDNLHRIGQAATVVATQDRLSIQHRQSSVGRSNWVGLGAFDWGGADGSGGYFSPRCVVSAAWCLDAETRPYNAVLAPAPLGPMGQIAAYEVFHCPEDTGAYPTARYVPGSGQSNQQDYLISVFLASGNSYHGDFLWHSGSSGGESVANRTGSFMRPYDATPRLDETILFYDTPFAQAYMSTVESSAPSPVQVPSWHGEARHNVLRMDGHADAVEINVSGSMVPIDSFPIDEYPFRSGMFRGPGWRYDAFPEETIVEHYWGNPFTAPAPDAAPALMTAPIPIAGTGSPGDD